MDEVAAAKMMSALAQPTRLKVVVLLSGAGRAGMGSSDIADALGIPRNLMSSHLAILSKADVLASRKNGRAVVYWLNVAAVLRLGGYLSSLV